MRLIAKISNYLRGSIEKEEAEEYSGGFLCHKVREKTASLIKEDGRLLDVGAGEGLLLRALQGKNSKLIYAIDFDPGLLRKAIERFSDKRTSFILGDGRYLPFKDEVFDEVTMLNLFMNIPDINIVSSILKEAFRVCSIGGRVIFDYRNLMNPWIFLSYKTVFLHDPDIKVPLRAFRKKEIRSLLDSIGIRDIIYHPLLEWWRVNSPIYLVEAYKVKS